MVPCCSPVQGPKPSVALVVRPEKALGPWTSRGRTSMLTGSDGDAMERMNSLDAVFVAAEDSINHMHIGSVGIFDGPPPPFDDVRVLIASKLPLVPRYRQRVREAP